MATRVWTLALLKKAFITMDDQSLQTNLFEKFCLVTTGYIPQMPHNRHVSLPEGRMMLFED